jgi:hypothetical protein
MPTVAELIKALPSSETPDAGAARQLPRLIEDASLLPVPVGRLRRLGLLSSLQAKIGAAYLFYWIRGWFQNAPSRERSLAETHWQTAARLLDSMGYLRGAAMKVGQTLANFPDIAPREFVETLEQLHFDAPPMHWSLLREMVRNELGDDPERLFASFEQRAFAAASLGQVHRATLHGGPGPEDVVVKIQYPGIARSIRDDLRNLSMFLLPSRLSKDWEYVREQFSDLCARLEMETNYEAEAATQTKIRSHFREDDGVAVARVVSHLSTTRVMTMERLPGVHLEQFVAGHPSQEARNQVAARLVRAWYRMMYSGRMLYVDFHPGNILVTDEGHVGLLDFGMMVPLEGELWELMRLIDRPLTTGKREDRIAANRMWCELEAEPWDAEREELLEQYADWCWRPRYCGGEFDFADEADFRQGVQLFSRMVARRYSRAKACTPVIARSHFGWRSILYRLKATVNIRAIAEDEIKATGWDRREYA